MQYICKLFWDALCSVVLGCSILLWVGAIRSYSIALHSTLVWLFNVDPVQNIPLNFFYTHLSYSFNFTVVYLCQIMGGIPLPSGGVVSKKRSTRRQTTVRSKRVRPLGRIYHWKINLVNLLTDWILVVPVSSWLVTCATKRDYKLVPLYEDLYWFEIQVKEQVTNRIIWD